MLNCIVQYKSATQEKLNSSNNDWLIIVFFQIAYSHYRFLISVNSLDIQNIKNLGFVQNGLTRTIGKIKTLQTVEHIVVRIHYAFCYTDASGYGNDLPTMKTAVVDNVHDVVVTAAIVFCPRHIKG